MALIIPVALARPRSGANSDFSGRPPTILVYAASDIDWTTTSPRGPVHNRQFYCALLDTGTDGIAIDETIAVSLKAPKVRSASVHGWMGTAQADIVKIQLIEPTNNIVFDTEAAVRDFRGAGEPWEIILGRLFLKRCRLTIDGPQSKYALEWIG